MFLFLITPLLLFLWIYFHWPTRFYIYSFFFPWLYDHPTISKFLGIRYEDNTWKTNRVESRVYLSGMTVWILTRFMGMDFILEDHTRKIFEGLQMKKSKLINMERYLDELDGKSFTIVEFEDFLSKNVIKETNRLFEILGDDDCDWLVVHSKVLRTVFNSVTNNVFEGIKMALYNWKSMINMCILLRSVPEEKRILLIGPQLSLIHNFTKMIMNKNGDMSNVEPYDFLEPLSKFFVAHTINPDGSAQLVFLDRIFDKRNTTNNKAFGPNGLQCPAALYTFKFIQDVIKFLKLLTIEIDGKPVYKIGRFKDIVNKDEIMLSFKKIV